jgi:hypothetical protein
MLKHLFQDCENNANTLITLYLSSAPHYPSQSYVTLLDRSLHLISKR